MEDNVLIDTLIFTPWLATNWYSVLSMFDSHHRRDCCEDHWLDFSDALTAFEEVEKRFEFIEKIEIKWTPWMGITLFFYWDKYEEDDRVWIFIPWRNSNNWYYSTNLVLIVTLNNWYTKKYDIEEYQE